MSGVRTLLKVQLVQKILLVSVTLWSFSRIVHKATSLLESAMVLKVAAASLRLKVLAQEQFEKF